MKVQELNAELQNGIRNKFDIELPISDINTLRRAGIVLDRFHLLLAGCDQGRIDKDEVTGKYTLITEYVMHGKYFENRTVYRDYYSPAIKRIADICKKHSLAYFIQQDPRGCPLYIAPIDAGMNDRNYSSFQPIYNAV